jgi:GNAT superfamily N-acetyltransferase
MTLRTVPVRGRADLERFIDLPWKVYAGDPHWVPPLRLDVRKLLTPGQHPFHEHAVVQPFLALRDERVVGRIVAHVNHAHNEFYKDALGFFGLFECLDDPEAAAALFDTAFAWLRERGRDRAQGPMDLSTNEVCGLLIGGEPGPPTIMMPHNPLRYAQLYERAGLTKAKDLVALYQDDLRLPERMVRYAEALRQRFGVRIRRIDMKRFNAEIELILSLYNRSWERNWGFVPMTAAEVRHMASELKYAVNPAVVLFLERIADGEPVGFGLALPDMNQAVRHANGRLLPFGLLKILWHKRHIDCARVLALAIVPEWRGKGLDSLLTLELYRNGAASGYRRGEYSWILEDNHTMRTPLERAGARVYRTYRIYEKLL